MQASFGNNAAEASTANPQLNARVVVATYQTLGVDTDDGDASFLTTHYPPNYFSHIIIDEAHRSAWGKWSEVLTRNSEAVQIGLTATPRELEYPDDLPDAQADREITANNRKYFGEPVYEYSIGQGIEDGYLALMELHKNDIFLNQFTETEEVTGLRQQDLENKELTEVGTGRLVSVSETRGRYEARSFERALSIPQRDHQMCCSLFLHLLATGGPEQKTIIFCASDSHADNISTGMNNLYAQWCASEARTRVQYYAFKCTAAEWGNNFLPDFRGSSAHHFIATTVDLLSTGVDVPCVNNIVFFRYLNSPITLYQMVGRGTRLHPQTNKLMFRVYDYTDATRLFGEDFKTAFSPAQPPDEDASADNNQDEYEEARGHRPMPLLVHGINVRITDAGTYIMTTGDDGQPLLLSLEEYKARLAAKLVEDIPALDDFRTTWVDPEQRHEMMSRLPDGGRAPLIVRELTQMKDYDLYDVLADVGYGQAPKTREDRAASFQYKHQPHGFPPCPTLRSPYTCPRHRLPVRPRRHRQPGEPRDFPHPRSRCRRRPARPASLRRPRLHRRRNQAPDVRGVTALPLIPRSDLPAGWKRMPLSDVALINPPRRRNLTPVPDSPVTFVPMQAVNGRLPELSIGLRISPIPKSPRGTHTLKKATFSLPRSRLRVYRTVSMRSHRNWRTASASEPPSSTS